jgi:hypothetical protein
LDCFNSADGSGLFSGLDRYSILAARASIVAVQSRDMAGFWAKLCHKMLWAMPPKRMDEAIVTALTVEDPAQVLRTLATEATSIVMLARMLHDEDKAARKAAKADYTDNEIEEFFKS